MRSYDFSKITLTIEVTKLCNLYCENCYLNYESRTRNRSLFQIDWLTKLAQSDMLQQCDRLYVSLLGGELTIVDQSYLRTLVDKVKELWPSASFSMVSNFFNSKPDFIDLYLAHSDVLETTFDFGRQNLNRNRDVFLSNFKGQIEAVAQARPDMPIDINFILNRQSIEYGPAAMLDYFSSFNLSENKLLVKFDHAIDFQTFRLQGMPTDPRSGVPIFPLDVTYTEYRNFVGDFRRLRDEASLTGKIVIPQLDDEHIPPDDRFFYTADNGLVVSLSSGGHITTNPLFTDIPSTFIGNISTDRLDDCFQSEQYFKIYAKERRRALECASCDVYDRCKGGTLFLPKYSQRDRSVCVGMKTWLDISADDGHSKIET